MRFLSTYPFKTTQYDYSYLKRSLANFSAKHQVNNNMFAYLFLVAAEDYFATVYYPTRFGRDFKNHSLLVDPKNLDATPLIHSTYQADNEDERNSFVLDLVFPLRHRNLEVIHYGYANDVISAYTNHALYRKPIIAYEPLMPNYNKLSLTGNKVVATLPVEQIVQSVLPSLADIYLPLFPKNNSATCKTKLKA